MSYHSTNVFVPLRAMLLAFIAAASVASSQELSNEAYRIRLQKSGAVEVSAQGVPGARVFAPAFTVLSRQDDPKYDLSIEKSIAYRIPRWSTVGGKSSTHELFKAGQVTTLVASESEFSSQTIRWHFTATTAYTLEAELDLPTGNAEPRIRFHFTPKRDGWFSVGYTGAPEIAPQQLQSLWQPLVWQERRFPGLSYFSVESMCSVPATLAQHDGATVGVVADPEEIPFRQPTHRNSLFGVLLRNPSGNAQPMIFAPVFGLPNSKMKAGQRYSFSLRLFLSPGDCITAYRNIARGLFGFRDYRQNATCSLNETLENMIDLAMNDQFSGWVPEQKASDYLTDVPGAVKNVSALHPLSIALITDSETIYRRRALPMTEYMLSREKYLFSPREGVKGQNASHLMRGPAAEVSELVSLHQMFQGRSEVFKHYALELHDKPRALNLEMVSEGGSWQNALALYRLTNDRKHLEKAAAGANDYIARRIDRPQADFADVRVESGGQFWSDFAPKWVDLFELYEETKDPRHLKAAVAGANEYSTYVWMQPRVPAGNILINKGGKVGIHYDNPNQRPQLPLRAPEQRVPAWRVAQIGLTPEAANTHAHNPSIFLTHFAAYMLRLGNLTDDSFFHDVARSAVVGRYSSFPGYDSNGEYTTIYSRPDYAMRPWREMTYNNVFYNHIWPHIALLMDFLVSDAYVKSDGAIHFPSRYAQGYAYLHSKVYGDRPGAFFGDENVRLWLPRKQLRLDTVQANYVTGYGNGNFYLALLNQSPDEQKMKVTLNPDVVPVNSGEDYSVRMWTNNQPAGTLTLSGGEMTVPLSARGITALKIEKLKVVPQFHDHIFAVPTSASSRESFAIQETPHGKVNSMLLSMSPSVSSLFVWLEATPREIKEATLHFKQGKVERAIQDKEYPFEFSLPLGTDDTQVESWVEVAATNSARFQTQPVKLRR